MSLKRLGERVSPLALFVPAIALAASIAIFGAYQEITKPELERPVYIRCFDTTGVLLQMNADRIRYEGGNIILTFDDPESDFVHSPGPWENCTVIYKTEVQSEKKLPMPYPEETIDRSARIPEVIR